jgi:hypothetical protein
VLKVVLISKAEMGDLSVECCLNCIFGRSGEVFGAFTKSGHILVACMVARIVGNIFSPRLSRDQLFDCHSDQCFFLTLSFKFVTIHTDFQGVLTTM